MRKIWQQISNATFERTKISSLLLDRQADTVKTHLCSRSQVRMCEAPYLTAVFLMVHVVKRISLKLNVFVADELFCANGRHLLADSNHDGL